jgi:hypothetical protein
VDNRGLESDDARIITTVGLEEEFTLLIVMPTCRSWPFNRPMASNVKEPLRNRGRVKRQPALFGAQEKMQQFASQDREVIEKRPILFRRTLRQPRNRNRPAKQFSLPAVRNMVFPMPLDTIPRCAKFFGHGAFTASNGQLKLDARDANQGPLGVRTRNSTDHSARVNDLKKA